MRSTDRELIVSVSVSDPSVVGSILPHNLDTTYNNAVISNHHNIYIIYIAGLSDTAKRKLTALFVMMNIILSVINLSFI